MAKIHLHDLTVQIPVFDTANLRLLSSGTFKVKSRVGADKLVGTKPLMVEALTAINLSIDEGDRVGLIGHNGAGKSTLLKTIAGIYPPTLGNVNISSQPYFFGGGNSLNPDATGYENILLSMVIQELPMKYKEKIFNDIAEFSELGDYLNLPTRVYSSGMNARLSFALATMKQREILLVDEAIGAGDAQFSEKIRKRIDAYFSQSKIAVVASHSARLLEEICNIGVVMSGGKIIFHGRLDEALKFYADSLQ